MKQRVRPKCGKQIVFSREMYGWIATCCGVVYFLAESSAFMATKEKEEGEN